MAQKATVRQVQCAQLFCAHGYMPSGASSIVGNLSQESGSSLPSVFRDATKYKLDHGSEGLPQWRLDRLDDYEKFIQGKHPELVDNKAALWAQYGRMDYQVEYIVIEMKRDYPTLDAALRKGGSVSALTAQVCWTYERPSRQYANLANRIKQALLTFNSIPQGAPKADDTNLVAHLDSQADLHENAKVAGGAAAGTAVASGLFASMLHVASEIAWWEWALFGVVLFVTICGIAAMIQNGRNERLLRNAAKRLDPTADTSQRKPAQSGAPVAEDDEQSVHVDYAKEARDQEQAAIDAASGGSANKTQPAVQVPSDAEMEEFRQWKRNRSAETDKQPAQPPIVKKVEQQPIMSVGR